MSLSRSQSRVHGRMSCPWCLPCRRTLILYFLPDTPDVPLPHLRVSSPESMKLTHMVLSFYRFKNVIFEISPTEEVGDFEVKAKFMGVQMETFMLHYQVGTHRLGPEAL